MLTEFQQEKFRQVLDLNWEAKELADQGLFREAGKKMNARYEAENELRESMGVEAYNEFIDLGRRMFADKE